MNEKDKNEMLEAILNENEAYQCKLWAVIMAGADTYALIGGLSTLTGGAVAALGGKNYRNQQFVRVVIM